MIIMCCRLALFLLLFCLVVVGCCAGNTARTTRTTSAAAAFLEPPFLFLAATSSATRRHHYYSQRPTQLPSTTIVSLTTAAAHQSSFARRHHHGAVRRSATEKIGGIALSSRSHQDRRTSGHQLHQEQTGNNPSAGAAAGAGAPSSSLVLSSFLLCFACTFLPAAFAVRPCWAYDPSDYASETVAESVKALRDARGDVDATFKCYESIAAIITEGKGVGGAINYKGVQLDRGYVADEDTSVYNPGLTLLTESEKERLVEAVIDARKAGLEASQWNGDNELGYDFLREKLDPFHVTELRGYWKVAPFYGAVLYLAVLAVQQLAPREFFAPAYVVAALAFFAPAAILLSIGP